MTTSGNTETDSGPQCQTAEWIDKVISDTFDEFLTAISAKQILHTSEEYKRDRTLREQANMKIYDLINSYHSFCKLCEQHFYSRSISSDINSFFQKHMNTSHHRQRRTVDLPPDDEPMFTWEVKFLSGRCNVCKMSGLSSYVLDTKFDPMTLMKLHVCVWDQENRETNEKVLWKLSLLKNYCRLKIFQEKLIKTVNGSVVCLLCGLKLPWPQEKASCHLGSDEHYQKFCLFLQKCFNFTPKDVLNGFNLEVVTRALIVRDPPPITNFTDCDDEAKCLTLSNDSENPYQQDKDNFSFSPKHLDKLAQNEETDFIHNNGCLLCNVSLKAGHFDSDLHQGKAKNLDKQSFGKPENYNIYCRNVKKRLHMMNNWEKLKLGQKEPPPPPIPSAPKVIKQVVENTSPQVIYFKTLLREKLELVKFVFTMERDSGIFCQVCDDAILSSHEILHINSPCHRFHEERWEELKILIENNKFAETFEKVRGRVVCLVCGVLMCQKDFFSHLKGKKHKRKFEWYSSLGLSIPISSAIVFREDLSCFCSVCNLLLSKRMSLPALEVAIRNVRHHWPCPELKGKDIDLSKSEPTLETNEKVAEDKQSLVQELSEPREGAMDVKVKGHGEDEAFDFRKVEKTLKRLVDVFESEIIEKVIEKSESVIGLVGGVNNSRGKILRKEVSAIGKETPCGCDQSSVCSCTGKLSSVAGKKEDEKVKKTRGSELRDRKTENNANHEEGGPVKEEKGTNEGENHEVLLIKGLSKSKRRYEFIYSKFSVFGKIRYVFFEGKLTILAFANVGVAEEAAKGCASLINDQKLTCSVSTRKAFTKSGKKAEEKLPSLHKSLVQLLEDPQKLMDFVLNLTMQAMATSQSATERKREELVCNSIILAISECFPQGRCYPFGSRLTGLTLNNSDFDVFLDCGGMYEGLKNTTPAKERRLVNKVAKLLRKRQEITEIIVVDRARVPIVSFLHKPTLMHCDLSFKNGLSVQNTLLIKFMTSLDWRVRPLILFLKHWAKLNGLHGPPNFSSYAIVMLVIFYLEQLEHPVLPTVESLQRNCLGRRTTIGGWDCSINMNTSVLKKSQNTDPFPQLLVGLFQLYAGFDFKSYVISPLTGRLLPRKVFSSSGVVDMPMCYKRHILNLPQPIENLVSNKIPICIIDPFDVSHVLTKGFTSRSLQAFTHLCQESEKYLRKGMIIVSSES